MHELGIVFHVIHTLEDLGKENDLKQISKVTMEIGEVSGALEDYLYDCWRWAADKTEILKGAELNVEIIPAVTYCEDCKGTYATMEHGKICPLCGSEHTYLQQGQEINIKEIEAC